LAEAIAQNEAQMDGIDGELGSSNVTINCAASLSASMMLRNKHKMQKPYRAITL
jgi:hypothetical protein